MSAQIIEFPFQHGNPEDPNVEVIKSAFPAMTDPEARKFTREFQAARQRHARETAGMTKAQLEEFLVDCIAVAIQAAPRKSES